MSGSAKESTNRAGLVSAKTGAVSCVTVDGLSVRRGAKKVYRDFSVSFACNEITAILGPSGSGKTTLLDCIAGLLKPQDGVVRVGNSCGNYAKDLNPTDSGAQVKTCGVVVKTSSAAENGVKAVSCLFQEPRLLPWRTLLQNVLLPLENLLPRAEAEERACMFLEKTGLLGRKNDLPADLSGGERQRTAIARAFAFPAPVLLMDEAFQSQDLGLKTRLMKLLRSLLESEPRTVIMVSHDVYEVLYLADRVLVFSDAPVRIILDEKKESSNESLLWLETKIINALSGDAR